MRRVRWSAVEGEKGEAERSRCHTDPDDDRAMKSTNAGVVHGKDNA